MPRSGSGVYSKPAGTTAVAGTTIESAKYNQTIDDLVQDANTARPITAGGTGATNAADARTNLGLSAALLTTGGTMTGTLYSTAETPLVFKNSTSNDRWHIWSSGGILNVYWDALGGSGTAYSRLQLNYNNSLLTLNSGQGVNGRLQFSCSWGNRSVYTDAGAIGFQNGAGAWNLYVTDTGEVWSRQFGDLATRIEDRAIAWANDRVTSLQYRLVSFGESNVGVVPDGAVMVGYDLTGRTRWRYPQVFDPVRGWVGFYVA